jgi:hypothetical protein
MLGANFNAGFLHFDRVRDIYHLGYILAPVYSRRTSSDCSIILPCIRSDDNNLVRTDVRSDTNPYSSAIGLFEIATSPLQIEAFIQYPWTVPSHSDQSGNTSGRYSRSDKRDLVLDYLTISHVQVLENLPGSQVSGTPNLKICYNKTCQRWKCSS